MYVFSSQVPVDGPPTMDLFKAIFQDSDSDSNSDSEKEKTSSPKRDEEDHHSLTGSSSHPITSSESRATTHGGISAMEKSSTVENMQASTTTAKPGQRRARVSRFEPQNKDTTSQDEEPRKPTNQPEDISKLTFIPRKKDPPTTKSALPVAQGIFANVDLVALNSYRNQGPAGPDKEVEQVKPIWPEAVTKAAQDKTTNSDSSSSSTDSEDVYGPPAPNHLRNRAQVIQSSPTVTLVTMAATEVTVRQKGPGWVEREAENSKSSTKKHKHKARSKSKKEKKKKKDKKSKKHKEKKKKKDHKSSSRRRRSNSSSSGSESSSSDSD